jgi:hypothetical protein
MHRYGKHRNDNYVVNVCDDVVLFKHTHKDWVKKTNKMLQMTWERKIWDSHYKPLQDTKQSISVVIMNDEKTW